MLARVVGYAINLLNNSTNSCHPHPLQLGCPNFIPCLRGFPFWRRSLEFYDKQLPGAADIRNQSFVSIIEILEENFRIIKEEFFNLRNWHDNTENSGTGFQHYRSPMQHPQQSIDNKNDPRLHDCDIVPSSVATDKGDWNVFYFYLHGLNFEDNLRKCPKTAEILRHVT